MDMVVARGGKQQGFGFGAEQLAHAGQHDMADDFGAGRTAGFAGDDGADAGGVEPVGEQPDLRRLAGALTAFEGDEATARSGALGIDHRHSFATPARNRPTANSLAPSIARCVSEPVPTASAA